MSEVGGAEVDTGMRELTLLYALMSVRFRAELVNNVEKGAVTGPRNLTWLLRDLLEALVIPHSRRLITNIAPGHANRRLVSGDSGKVAGRTPVHVDIDSRSTFIILCFILISIILMTLQVFDAAHPK